MINGGIRTKGITKTNTIGKPLISVITVVFNGEKTLEQTILSVVNQTYENVEYIIVDGGSKDGTLDIIKKYEDKIDYWQSEPDKGVYDAMNKGITLAEGEYVYILGCDDWLISENIFDNVLPYLKNNDDVISGKVWIVYKNGYQQLFENNQHSSIENDVERLKISSPHQGMFVKTSVMKKYPFDIHYKIAADYKSLLTLWLNKDISILKIPLIIAYFSSDGLSDRMTDVRIKENYEILKEFGLFYTDYSRNKNFKRFIIWYIKCFLKKLGVGFIRKLVLHIINRLNKKYIKHSCGWTECRVCAKKSMV